MVAAIELNAVDSVVLAARGHKRTRSRLPVSQAVESSRRRWTASPWQPSRSPAWTWGRPVAGGREHRAGIRGDEGSREDKLKRFGLFARFGSEPADNRW